MNLHNLYAFLAQLLVLHPTHISQPLAKKKFNEGSQVRHLRPSGVCDTASHQLVRLNGSLYVFADMTAKEIFNL